MSESQAFGPHNEGVSRDTDPELEATKATLINQAVQPLTDRVEQGGLGAQGRAEMANRARHIIESVNTTHPDQIRSDASKPRQDRLEHDAEKAHLIAIATDADETFIAKDKARQTAKDEPDGAWSGKRQRAEVAVRIDRNLVEETYKEDPTVGPNSVRLLQDMAKDARKPMWRRWLGL